MDQNLPGQAAQKQPSSLPLTSLLAGVGAPGSALSGMQAALLRAGGRPAHQGIRWLHIRIPGAASALSYLLGPDFWAQAPFLGFWSPAPTRILT